MLYYLKTVFFFLSLIFCTLSFAEEPWLTGSILSIPGRNLGRGHTDVEMYVLDIDTTGQYDNLSKVRKVPTFKSLLFNPIWEHGYTDWLDIQASIPYTFNSVEGKKYHRLADVSIGAGFQLVEQTKSKWLPDIRLYLQETFPTGRFDNLNPALLGADATGLGSYRTLYSLNFEYLMEVYDSHYLRTRLNLSRLKSSAINVSGLNSFGGTENTRATVNPGDQDNIDLSFEYTLTKNWVAVMEGYFAEGQSVRFNGILDVVNNREDVLSDEYYEYAVAPALEYNFSENWGVIGGVWFPVIGRNTSFFTTYVIAINAYW